LTIRAGKSKGNKKIKFSLLADDIIVCTEITKGSLKEKKIIQLL
jgi:hypothetical protein